MDDILRKSMLFDYYGELLTERKRSIMEMYLSDDMSLSEIAECMKISRAAVFDALKSAEKKLEGYEEKLGLIKAYERREALRKRAHELLDGDAAELRSIIDELTDYKEER